MPIFPVLLIGAAAEIAVLVLVAQAIGALPTLGLLLAGALLGTWLVKREGRRMLAQFREAATARRPADREVSDGVLIAGGGLLFLVPGFLSDLAGLVCVLPPTRSLLRRRMQRSAERRAQAMREQVHRGFPGGSFGAVPFGTAPSGGGPSGPAGRRDATGDVIDGEVVSVSEDDEEQPRQRPDSDDGGPDALPPRRGPSTA
ncbi:FxsA family protein [Salinifilum ghardaiensis]